MSAPIKRTDRVNLAAANVLLVCGDLPALNILAEMFAGFGVSDPKRCQSMEDAQAAVHANAFNLIVVDSALSDAEGYDFIHWLRRCEIDPNCYAPVVLVTGHTKRSQVCRGRDVGASFVVAKPVVPLVMMQRIIWLMADQRQFVSSPNYCGPDRRVKCLGPPVGTPGRRHDDLSSEVGAANGPNLAQDEIDALFNPKAAA